MKKLITNREDAINYLLDNECSADGVERFVDEMWNATLENETNLLGFQEWWENHREEYL